MDYKIWTCNICKFYFFDVTCRKLKMYYKTYNIKYSRMTLPLNKPEQQVYQLVLTIQHVILILFGTWFSKTDPQLNKLK